MNSEYQVWKEWHCGRGRLRVAFGDRLLGYVISKEGADLLIEQDKVIERMYAAPLESRRAPTMFDGVAID